MKIRKPEVRGDGYFGGPQARFYISLCKKDTVCKWVIKFDTQYQIVRVCNQPAVRRVVSRFPDIDRISKDICKQHYEELAELWNLPSLD